MVARKPIDLLHRCAGQLALRRYGCARRTACKPAVSAAEEDRLRTLTRRARSSTADGTCSHRCGALECLEEREVRRDISSLASFFSENGGQVHGCRADSCRQSPESLTRNCREKRV
ncbi:hypothetical protein MRX96_007062 [Rhipicephalus microplus]